MSCRYLRLSHVFPAYSNQHRHSPSLASSLSTDNIEAFSVMTFSRASLKALTLNPAYMAPSAWWQHVPIAHWLVNELKPARVVELGSHYGVSFFAFCEAAEAFSPETFIYAIDTWEGDAHAGHYDGNVYQQVRHHWGSSHRHRSQLIRTSFDDAVNYFPDNSIDLLHIDGLHTYEAVKHDYMSWTPKMKKESIILFHDINVRERDFGVWQLWEGIKGTTSGTIETANGHGLGILIHGESMAARLEALPTLMPLLVAKGALLERIAELTLSKSQHNITSAAEIEKAWAETSLARSEAEIAKSRADQAINEVQQAQDQAAKEIKQAQDQAETYKSQLNQIIQSRAWRLTAPLRKSKEFFMGHYG